MPNVGKEVYKELLASIIERAVLDYRDLRQKGYIDEDGNAATFEGQRKVDGVGMAGHEVKETVYFMRNHLHHLLSLCGVETSAARIRREIG